MRFRLNLKLRQATKIAIAVLSHSMWSIDLGIKNIYVYGISYETCVATKWTFLFQGY